MIRRNPVFTKLSPLYLFHEVARRKKIFLEKNPNAKLISLSVGDTTEPIPESIVNSLSHASHRLGTVEGYTGYGPEQGSEQLRHLIASTIYHNTVSADDIFISDGAKCDLGRLQKLFGGTVSIALQNPTYPVYLDGSMMQGVQKVVRLPCSPENQFWPNWEQAERTDLIYWCSPNNPTGVASTRAQLAELVNYAKRQKSIILFDAAYFNYVQDDALPRSIYEIDGAQEVAIEVNSFSKLCGFTGVRLGWTIVPEQLKYEDGFLVKEDWKRVTATIFNGASNIAQQGGIAALQPQGLEEVRQLTQFYLKNASLLKDALERKKFQVFGADHAPYLWVKIPEMQSWEAFQFWLEEAHLVTTPGSGFGSCGEGFLRLTAFGSRAAILEAAQRIDRLL